MCVFSPQRVLPQVLVSEFYLQLYDHPPSQHILAPFSVSARLVLDFHIIPAFACAGICSSVSSVRASLLRWFMTTGIFQNSKFLLSFALITIPRLNVLKYVVF